MCKLIRDTLYVHTALSDAVENGAQTTSQTNLRFDTATGSPIYSLPAEDSYIGEPWQLLFELPEPALSGSVQLEIIAETGNIVDDRSACHNIVQFV